MSGGRRKRKAERKKHEELERTESAGKRQKNTGRINTTSVALVELCPEMRTCPDSRYVSS